MVCGTCGEKLVPGMLEISQLQSDILGYIVRPIGVGGGVRGGLLEPPF